MKTHILLEVTHTEKATDLVDKIAGRAWTLEGVEDVIAKIVQPNEKNVELLSQMEVEMERKPWEPFAVVKAKMINGLPYVEARYLQEAAAEIARLKEAIADYEPCFFTEQGEKDRNQPNER